MDQKLFISTDTEADFLHDLITTEFDEVRVDGYETTPIVLTNFMALEGFTEDRYQEEVIVEAMQALGGLLNKPDYVEFAKPEVMPGNRERGAIQVVGGRDGLWFRKTTDARLFLHEKRDEGMGILTTYEVFIRSSPKIEFK